MRKRYLLLSFLLLLALTAWAPWVTADFARARVEAGFVQSWQGVADGCGLNCKGCGVVRVEKTLFGARVTLEYACGLLPSDSPEYHQRSAGWVSFLGTLHGFPRP